ncbi:glycosyltransferase [Burkholderia multivorans]|uniref:glycosyltransferase n=1 Tax=Burkholderia multivorans TaxID=87883 RepID=UPI001C2180A8|nr:glycosyltransferase [Burkholderia multivorans]MBU9501439.1 glycosyltransferase [Burkholderia multivorans]
MRVAAVVVTHNRPELLIEAIGALREQTHAIDELIVVDNASGAKTVEVLKRMQCVDVLRLDENVGGAGGFAAGVQRALDLGADWILLLDDDAIAMPSLVEELLAQLEEIAPERVGAICSTVMEFGRIAPMHRRRFDPATLAEPVIDEAAYTAGPVRIDCGSFVGFLVNAEAVRAVGLPNASFFLAYDDTEYSLRLGRAGWSVWLAPEAVVDHRRPAGARLRSGPYGVKHYYNLRNQLAVFRHYGTAPKWRLAKPLMLHGLIAARDGRIDSLRRWLKAWRDSWNVRI